MYNGMPPSQIRQLGRWQFPLAQFIEDLRGSLSGSGDPLGREMEEAVLQALRNRLEQWNPHRDVYDAAWFHLTTITVLWASSRLRRDVSRVENGGPDEPYTTD